LFERAFLSYGKATFSFLFSLLQLSKKSNNRKKRADITPLYMFYLMAKGNIIQREFSTFLQKLEKIIRQEGRPETTIANLTESLIRLQRIYNF
jgi:hypothetical protein